MCTFAGIASEENNSRSSTLISTLGLFLFIRHYLRIPIWFQILHLLICLNSAGCFAWCHVHALHKAVNTMFTAMQVASSRHCSNTTWCIKQYGLMHSHHAQVEDKLQRWKHWHKHALRNAPRALLRSMVNWFTEFCNSQWLLHFAAPFINMWTKTSVAEIIYALCLNNIAALRPITKNKLRLLHR